METEEVIPDFILTSLDGRQLSPRNYKQPSNLVLVYFNVDRCGDCVAFLQETADNYHVYVELEAEILALAPKSTSDLEGRLGSLGLPFPVMSDEGGKVGRCNYKSMPRKNLVRPVFIADRFGALRAEMVTRSLSERGGFLTVHGVVDF